MSRNRNIRYLIMDVDGTLTDGKIYIGQDGEGFKAFCVKDGYGIRNILRKASIVPVILTGRRSVITQNRCKELKIDECYQGVNDKLGKLMELQGQWNCSMDRIAYIGDDLNDYECMDALRQAGGLVGCPADAVNEVRKIADYVCCSKGGNGAVREYIEWLVKQ